MNSYTDLNRRYYTFTDLIGKDIINLWSNIRNPMVYKYITGRSYREATGLTDTFDNVIYLTILDGYLYE